MMSIIFWNSKLLIRNEGENKTFGDISVIKDLLDAQLNFNNCNDYEDSQKGPIFVIIAIDYEDSQKGPIFLFSVPKNR